jgi:hypothetical protein
MVDEIETSVAILATRLKQRTKLPEKIYELPSQRWKPLLQSHISNSFQPNGHKDVEAEIRG